MTHKILITGANRGIGLEMSKQLGLQGYKVILGVKDLSKGQIALHELVQAGVTRSQLDLVQVDLQNPESLINAANYVEKNIPI